MEDKREKRDAKASPGLIEPHGGYRSLRSYQMSEIVYDAATAFCNRFIERRSRTHDQMVQAARSGKQNIAEGSMASGTSRKTELKLVGVARASLEELLSHMRAIGHISPIGPISKSENLKWQRTRSFA